MAYFVPYDDRNKEQEYGQEPGQGGGLIGGAGGAGEGVGGATAPRKGTEFATLQKYLQGGKEGSAALAEKLASGAEQARSAALSPIEEAQSQLGSQLQPIEQRNIGGVIGGSISPYAPQYSSPYSLSIRPQADAAKIQEAKQMLSSAYGGPSKLGNLVDVGAARESAKLAEEKGGLLGTEAGRLEALRSIYEGRPYKRGVAALDQALLQSSPEAKARLQSAYEGTRGLGDKISEMQSAANQRIGAAQEKYGSEREQLRSSLWDTLRQLGQKYQGKYGSSGYQQAMSGLGPLIEEITPTGQFRR